MKNYDFEIVINEKRKVMLVFSVKFKTNIGGENEDMLKIINLLLCPPVDYNALGVIYIV